MSEYPFASWKHCTRPTSAGKKVLATIRHVSIDRAMCGMIWLENLSGIPLTGR